MWLLDKITVRL